MGNDDTDVPRLTELHEGISGRWYRSTRFLSQVRPDLVLVPLLLTLVFGRGYLTGEGYIYLAEQFEVYTVADYRRIIYPLWDTQRQEFSVAETQKIYFYLPIVAIGQLTESYKVLQSILLLSPFFFGYVSAYLLSSRLVERQEISGRTAVLACHVGAFVFVANPWVINSSRNVLLRLSYAFFPALIYLYIRSIESERPDWSVYFALLLALVGTYRLNVLVGLTSMVVLALYVLYRDDRRRALKYTVVGYSLAILLSFAKFLPAVLYSSSRSVVAIEEFTLGHVRRAPMHFVFSGVTNVENYPGFTFVYTGQLLFVFLLVTAFSLVYLLRVDRRDEFHATIPVAVFVLGVLLNAREANVDGVLMSLPGAEYLGRLLRQPKWNSIPLLASISVMTTFSISHVLSVFSDRTEGGERVLVAAFLATCILLVASASAWPLFTGDMDGYWDPSPPPSDYVEVNDRLADGPGSNALWAPSFHGRNAVWSEQEGETAVAAPVGFFPERSSARSTFRSESYFFQYYRPTAAGLTTSGQPIYQGALAPVYDGLDLGYVVLHYDGEWLPIDGISNAEIRQDAFELREQQGVTPLYEGDHVAAFRLENGGRTFRAVRSFSTFGGLETASSVAVATGPGEPAGLVFENDRPTDDWAGQSGVLVQGGGLSPIPVSEEWTIAPARHTTVTDLRSEREWVSSGVRGSSFQTALLDSGIRWPWQFDHHRGVVFTDGTWNVPDDAQPRSDDLYDDDVEKNATAWRAQTGAADHYELDVVDGKLLMRLGEGTSSWPRLTSPRVAVETGVPYQFQLDVRGEHVPKLLVRVIELDSNGEEVAANLISTGWVADGSADFDESIVADYTPSNASTEYLQVQFDQSIQVDEPHSDGSLWIDDIALYDMSSQAEPTSLRIPVSIDSAGEYTVSMRYLESRAGGQVNVNLDGERIGVDTHGSTQEFVWEELSTRHLDAGESTLVLENVRGFNAINLITLAPADEHERRGDRLAQEVWNETVIHLLEAESDLSIDGGTVRPEQNASNGQVVAFEDSGSAGRIVRTASAGRYRIAVRGEGNFTVVLDDHRWNVSRETLGFAHSEPITLDRGPHDIEIHTDDDATVNLDVVWLYSTPRGEAVGSHTIGDVLAADPSAVSIQSTERVSATEYRVRVNASEPFVLSFAQGYDPMWVAEARTPNGTVQYEAVPLYGTISGFPITETGEYDIVVRYRPQRWLEHGTVVSALTLVICVGYLVDRHSRRG